MQFPKPIKISEEITEKIFIFHRIMIKDGEEMCISDLICLAIIVQ